MKQQILNLIALRPNIRLVEISDKLDIDMDIIRPMIQAEIGNGMIVVGSTVALNGLIVDTFLSKVQMPVVQRKPVPSAPAIVKATASAKPPTSKVETAIAYLRENGPVPAEFLGRAMGLKKGEYPSQYLSAALRDGRVVCENKEWKAGPVAKDAPALPAAKILLAVAPAAKEIPAPVVIPRFVPAPKVPELAPKAAPVMDAPEPLVVIPADVAVKAVPGEPVRVPDIAAARFVAGLMSNGELMLDVDGRMTTLTPEQTKTLHGYLTKVGYALLVA